MKAKQRSLGGLLALTHVPMAVFTVGILPVTVLVLAMVDAKVASLAEASLSGVGTEEALGAFAWHVKLIWLACLGGFLASVGAATALTLWIRKQVMARVTSHLAFVDAVIDGRAPQPFQSEGTDLFSRLEGCLGDLQEVLEARESKLLGDAALQRFHTQLAQAMTMSDDEPEALALTARALAQLGRGAPAELLLADSSQAHLRRELVAEGGEAPGCPVVSPRGCHAVRRGATLVFEDSEALDACPKLRERDEGPCSAVCVPVNVMGRAVGVLHMTGPHMSPPDRVVQRELTYLADQLGTRVGMLRALATSQLQADTDPLTGLLNRRSFDARVRPLLDRGVPMSVVMCDLDHFKKLNDTYGHATGDKALRLFTQVLEASLPESAVIGRLGGEEFAVCLPEAGMRHASEHMEGVRDALGSAIPRANMVSFTCSMGVTHTRCAGWELQELLAAADAQLYRAKEAGRDRVVLQEDAAAAA